MIQLITNFIKCRVFCSRFLNKIKSRSNRRQDVGLIVNMPDIAKKFSEKASADPLSILKDILGDGYLFAVPKGRRSIERRLIRKHWPGRLLLPKKNIVACDVCGHFHPVHAVCGNCYEKVKKETELIQEAIVKEQKLDPVDKEVIILYQNEPKEDKEFFQGKRIVELPKERPQWFSKNLLVKESGTARKPEKTVNISQEQAVVKSD